MPDHNTYKIPACIYFKAIAAQAKEIIYKPEQFLDQFY
jgi:hypothetical protein